MPRQLALLLCTVFVLFLLRLERRGSAGVSHASWIPTVWMLAISSKSLGAWFGAVGTLESGSFLDRLLLTALGVAGIAVLAVRRNDWSGALSRHGWLLAVLAYMFVSTAWSDIPFIALKRWVREVILVIMALVVASEVNPRQALESLLRRSAYILIPFSLLLIKYYPALGVQYGPWTGEQMWVGVTYQKNSLGRLCLISAFFLLWTMYRHWREPAAKGRYNALADLSVLLITLFLFKGSDEYSATSIATFAVGIASYVGLAWLRKLRLRVPQAGLLAVAILVIGIGVSAPFLRGSNLAAFTSALGRDKTLTGRSEVWAELVPVVEQRPVLGCGFGSFWTSGRQDFYRINFAHNGYLDTLLELGAVGLALYTVWLLSCARKLHGALAEDYELASLGICFLAMAVVYNAAESAVSFAEQMTAVVALASFAVPGKRIHGFLRQNRRVRLHKTVRGVVGTAAWQPGSPKNVGSVRAVDRHGRLAGTSRDQTVTAPMRRNEQRGEGGAPRPTYPRRMR